MDPISVRAVRSIERDVHRPAAFGSASIGQPTTLQQQMLTADDAVGQALSAASNTGRICSANGETVVPRRPTQWRVGWHSGVGEVT
jgi:hypothetical protein